ncbi:MAG: hypothetical protein KGS61_00905 [Verrucomicrobia bacterium]|nr:hypothetical protein [Verrucomicrobiota bacterium]
MNATQPNLTPGQGKPKVKVVMLYEDLATGLRAKQTFDHLIGRLGEHFVFHSKLWKFGVLEMAACRDLAAADFDDADLILIAAHGTRQFPFEVKNWLDRCLAQARPGRRALVSLVDTRDETSADISALCDSLREVAEKASMDYFCRRADWLDEESGYSLEKLQERAQAKSSMIEEILRQSSSHARWGINE